jgi:hypothetical protein
MVVYPFVNSHAGRNAAANDPASADSGAWWCMVVYGGVSDGVCVPLLIVTQGTMMLLANLKLIGNASLMIVRGLEHMQVYTSTIGASTLLLSVEMVRGQMRM